MQAGTCFIRLAFSPVGFFHMIVPYKYTVDLLFKCRGQQTKALGETFLNKLAEAKRPSFHFEQV